MAKKTPADDLLWYMRLIGMIPYRTDSKFSILSYVYCIAMTTSILYYTLANLSTFLSKDVPWMARMACGQYFTSCFHISIKQINFLLKNKKTMDFINRADVLWKEASENPHNQNILNETQKSLRSVSKFLVYLFNSAIPTLIVSCTVDNIGKEVNDWRLPLNNWVPFRENYYWVAAFIQCIGMQTAVSSVETSMIFSRIFVGQMKAQMEILGKAMDNRPLVDHGRTNVKTYILHQKVLNLVKEYNDFWAIQLYLEMVLSSIQIAFRCSSLLKVVKERDSRIFSFCILLLMTMTAPYIICSNGTVIEDANEVLYRSTYQNNWYEENVKTRRDLLIFATMTTKPLKIQYKSVNKLSLEQYTTLLQVTYSYLAMLLHFSE